MSQGKIAHADSEKPPRDFSTIAKMQDEGLLPPMSIEAAEAIDDALNEAATPFVEQPKKESVRLSQFRPRAPGQKKFRKPNKQLTKKKKRK